MTFDRERFRAELEEDGCGVVPDVLPAEFVARARRALERAIAREAEYHGGTDYPDYGMVMLCALHAGEFLELFDNPRLLAPFEAALGEGCIVYAYTSSSMPPGRSNYSQRIHCDCPRLIPGYMTNMGATIALDDFTEENGATYYLPGSHLLPGPPPPERFFAAARRLIVPAGSVWYFNARVWHAGGVNRTGAWRHALTINMCRPYMKQRIDIPRAMSGMDMTGVSERVLQKLGFHSQVPASLDEYYAPPEARKFRQKAE